MRNRIADLVLLAGGLITSLAICEVTLHVIGFSYPTFETVDPITGTRLRAGVEGWFREEGNSYVRINSDGFRDREHTVVKPHATTRIAVLGDSYVEARQVAVEATFWAHLEKNLNACNPFAGKKAKVMNFGVNGYGTANELQALRERVWKYDPDIILLVFLTGNDIRNNSKVLSGNELRPFFAFSDGLLVLDNSFSHSFSFKLKSSVLWQTLLSTSDHLRMLQLLNKAANGFVQFTRQYRSTHVQNLGHEFGLDDNIYIEPQSTDWVEAWRVTEGLIKMMRDEVRQKGARFVLVTLSNGIQAHPNPQVRRAFMERLGITDLFYPDRRIRALAQREGIEMVMLVEGLQRHAERNKVFLHGFTNAVMGGGHWNEEGHRKAGNLLSDYFCGTRNSAISETQ